MSAELITHEPAHSRGALVPATPLDMLNSAVSSGASVEILERLMNLYERWDAAQSRRLFDTAIADAKAEIEPVVRNKTGHNSKRYADFAAIASAVDPVLGKHGLSYRFRTAQTDRISVTCILSHKGGHSEETTLSGPPDASGSKNAIQAIGSTLTYLQRYSLVQALGLAATDEDDDGRAAGVGATITDEQAQEIRVLIDEVGADIQKFCAYLKIDGIATMPAGKYQTAMSALKAKRVRT